MKVNSSILRNNVAAAIMGALAALAPPSFAQTPPKPNIIVIVADDQGYADIAVQGCTDIPTPNIDAFAHAGIRFTNAYVTAPVCCPSRAGLLTGRYQERFGVEENPRVPPGPEFGLPVDQTTLADALKSAGYATACVGKWHEGTQEKFRPLHRGFDEYFGFLHGQHSYLNNEQGDARIFKDDTPVVEKSYLTDAFTREAISFINRHPHDPFFLYLAYNAVHWPLEDVKEYADRFGSIKDIKRRRHAECVAGLDDGVGKVIADLKAQGLDQNTIVFYVSDNGGPTQMTTSSNAPLRGGKSHVYEGGIRTPAMIQWPGHLPAGKVDDRPILSLDIFATSIALAGAKVKDPSQLDGVNLLPYLDGTNSAPPHPALFWRFGDKWAARLGDWKLVVDNPKTPPELYNLANDIGETQNLADKNPAKLQEIQADYDQWNKKNVKPLWHDNFTERKAKGLEPSEAGDGQP